jgi:hypothetical protein
MENEAKVEEGYVLVTDQLTTYSTFFSDRAKAEAEAKRLAGKGANMLSPGVVYLVKAVRAFAPERT